MTLEKLTLTNEVNRQKVEFTPDRRQFGYQRDLFLDFLTNSGLSIHAVNSKARRSADIIQIVGNCVSFQAEGFSRVDLDRNGTLPSSFFSTATRHAEVQFYGVSGTKYRLVVDRKAN